MVEPVTSPDEGDRAGVERLLEARILDLLAQRGPGKTICPSEVARAVFREDDPEASGRHSDAGDPDDRSRGDGDAAGEGWRALMEPTRRAAGRLAASGQVVVTQGGQEVDLSTVTGPIRLRRKH